MRLGEPAHLVVGVDGLCRFAGVDGDARERAHQAAVAEHRVDEGQYHRVQRHLLVERAVGEEVVDAGGGPALEAVGAALDAQFAFEAIDVGVEGGGHVGVERVEHDGVAIGAKAIEVRGQRVAHVPTVPDRIAEGYGRP